MVPFREGKERACETRYDHVLGEKFVFKRGLLLIMARIHCRKDAGRPMCRYKFEILQELDAEGKST